MIEYLEQLVETGKYQQALELAEQLIGRAESPGEVVRIHVAQVRSHCLLGQYAAALAGGAVGKKLAIELGDWDSYGATSVYLGVAYARLGQVPDAILQIYDYIAALDRYRKASGLEHTAWYNLGILRLDTGEPQEAIKALRKSLDAAVRRDNHRFAHGVRQSLVGAYLRAGVTEPIPRLLAQCGAYLRNHVGMRSFSTSYAIYVKLRGEFLIATNRPHRSQLVALRALERVGSEPGCEMPIHYVLARAAACLDNGVEALGHALAARTCAVAFHRSDLEGQASELLYELTQTYSTSTEAIDEYYIRL